MIRPAAILLLLSALRLPPSAFADVTLQWDIPTNPAPVDIIIFHGTDSQPPEIFDVGLTNEWIYTGPLNLGPHYFAAAAFYETPSGLSISGWSNMAAITNVQAVAVASVLFVSTNLSDWSPLSTNRLVLCASAPQEFFRSATTIEPTNIVLAPLPAPR